MKITEPGIYYDLPTADYLSDPCPAPSLTQSIAKIILERSPLHAWHAHPRLNPDWKPDDPTKFDVGNIAHTLMIGRGKKIVVLDKFDDWRTNAAKDARAAALAEGKHAVLGKHYALADRMVKAAREQLDLRRLNHLFAGPGDYSGRGEVVIAWKEDSGFWCRQMIDWLWQRTFVDYKTTDMNAAPQNLARIMTNAGWPIQAAMAERGLNSLIGQHGHARRFLFVVQETDVPYCLNVVELSEGVMTMGRKMLAAAMSRWNFCIGADVWPGYPTEIIVPEYPGYAEAQWLEREQTEFGNVLMAG